ncbi:putative phage abortive infection protein [Cronobacter turicensis]
MDKRLLWGITAVIALMFFLYLIFLIDFVLPDGRISIADAGTFGDSFGVLTSLFSALAFIGVLLTYAAQKEESKLQKIELQESRREFKKQGFENTFFQLLKQHADFIKNLEVTDQLITKDGREVMNDIRVRLEDCMINRNVTVIDPEGAIQESFNDLLQQEGDRLSQYLGIIFIVLRFLSESEVEDKDIYIRLIKAQLYRHELYIIFHYALTPDGKHLKKYIAEFKLMGNLPRQELYQFTHADLIPDCGFPPMQ